ncbi:helix-turn-helix transcriptional regulator [Vagococcus sp. PNs007]|uniref:Helix-turn-helix transcriptional regulator n=1 Tax=Vagococcus proximus TaxID=2991417 RepID=A0ABT5X2L1_9ENTE|nr:helix-turn-helix transcriptional regulator [Vagococcus proximus]MDF0480241.1 helix-turn-helix transcriptional regulator [Vagococcus proximus]
MENNLKSLRVEKGYSQEELSKKAAISRPYLSEIENDLSSPSITVCLRLAKSLGCDLNQIFLDEL